MAIYKDFLGLNYGIYEPILDDPGAEGGNTLGYDLTGQYLYSDFYSTNPNISPITNHYWFKTSYLLNIHRNGPYGYPTWKQIRVSDNHLSRAQRKRNIFTYTEEPGPLLGNRQSRFGETRTFTEPVVVDSYKPLSLVGDVSVYNEQQGEFQDRSVELKTSFGNETAFFANKEVNEYFDTIHETDDNYEQLKELYLDGGLEDEGSPIDAFNLLVYRQTVFPKQQYAYLGETISRRSDINRWWRDNREERTKTNRFNPFAIEDPRYLPSQSVWPLDVAEGWATRPAPQIFSHPNPNDLSQTLDIYSYYIGGPSGSDFFGGVIGAFNTGDESMDISIGSPTPSSGGSGILMNSHAQFGRGFYLHHDPVSLPGLPSFTSSLSTPISHYLHPGPYYSRRHSYTTMASVVAPNGMEIEEATGFSIDREHLFEGMAAWDCPNQAGKNPFYDSYESFAEEVKLKGKGFCQISEFRISPFVKAFIKFEKDFIPQNLFKIEGKTDSASSDFYKVYSTTDFLKHFDLVKKDHKDLSKESIITLRCKALKKFLPYDGFYPAQRTIELAKEFKLAIENDVITFRNGSQVENDLFGVQGVLEPLFAPGVLFNTIKSGVAVDYPIMLPEDNPVIRSYDINQREFNNTTTPFPFPKDNHLLAASDIVPESALFELQDDEVLASRLNSFWSKRIDFESLVEPERLLSNLELSLQEIHPFGVGSNGELTFKWGGKQDPIYKKIANNFLAEVADMFLDNGNFTTIASKKEEDPEFGNVVSGSYYTMRLRMYHSTNKNNSGYECWNGRVVVPPQDMHQDGVRETITMYSRPSAFGVGMWSGIPGPDEGRLNDLSGYNFSHTPPYYHGEAWCDLIFKADRTGKLSLDEILDKSKKYPYYTRFWNPGVNDALRDTCGYFANGEEYSSAKYGDYKESDWKALFDESNPNANVDFSATSSNPANVLSDFTSVSQYAVNNNFDYAHERQFVETQFVSIGGGLITTQTRYTNPPAHPIMINYNAMQLDSSLNIFGKGIVREIRDLQTNEVVEVATDQTIRGKTRWIIQPKFETPILNFNKYNNLEENGCTLPQFASETVPRGMWHQYGEVPEEERGIFLQVSDIPESWLGGALAIDRKLIRNKVKSLADLVGFSKEPVRLGKVADVKEISEAVVAVPFIEEDGTRKFFSIPRVDIDSCIDGIRREVEPGRFVAGGPPKVGDSVYQMVKNMKKYVFPPSMDFVKYDQIDPFAMYIFEFKHNLTKQDLADIWQNLPPEIGTRIEEAEASISHELLAHELLGGGAVVKNGTLDDNAEGNGIPSNIQWMVFKAKKRAKTNYFDKVVAKKGTTEDTSSKQLENASGQTGDDPGITYNWPYDFFSLVELVKLDAEVTFANIENDDKGQKTIKKIEKKPPVERQKRRMKARNINRARGKGRFKK